MRKDIIVYDGKDYQLSTAYIYDCCFETMIFPIEDGVTIGTEVYAWRTYNDEESCDKHNDILNHPAKYLSEESIAEYLRLKEEDFYEEDDETVCITKKEYDELLEYKYMYEKLCD
jgi:hypothetical protein